MDRIPQETQATYDLLRADFEKADRVRVDNTVLAIAKLDAKFDLLSVRIDDVKVSVDIDIDEPRQGLDQSAPRPSNSLKRVPAVPIHGLSSGSNGSDSHRIDNENGGSGHKFYVPPPVREQRLYKDNIAGHRLSRPLDTLVCWIHFPQAHRLKRVPLDPLDRLPSRRFLLPMRWIGLLLSRSIPSQVWLRLQGNPMLSGMPNGVPTREGSEELGKLLRRHLSDERDKASREEVGWG
ncbi:hypothetical protein D1007_58798 [Hordeum vulgare]|nr:hypothetical protein D1007_58798 [Hordeum vulgare]